MTKEGTKAKAVVNISFEMDADEVITREELKDVIENIRGFAHIKSATVTMPVKVIDIEGMW